jgi:hypothetical protein
MARYGVLSSASSQFDVLTLIPLHRRTRNESSTAPSSAGTVGVSDEPHSRSPERVVISTRDLLPTSLRLLLFSRIAIRPRNPDNYAGRFPPLDSSKGSASFSSNRLDRQRETWSLPGRFRRGRQLRRPFHSRRKTESKPLSPFPSLETRFQLKLPSRNLPFRRLSQIRDRTTRIRSERHQHSSLVGHCSKIFEKIKLATLRLHSPRRSRLQLRNEVPNSHS